MTFRDDLLPDIDEWRSIPGEMGLHSFQVWVRLTTWTGARPGQGTEVVTETRLLVGGRDPHVREVRSKDVMGGSMELKSVEWEIGPLTKAWAGGGVPSELVDPEKAATGSSSIQYLLKGPGLPPTGQLCMRISDSQDRPFRIMIRIRSMGRRKP